MPPPYPQLAQRLKPITWHNRATYSCGATLMERTDRTGADALLDTSLKTAAK